MFSDLVGSTALSARMDPEDLREVISAYQKCVAETVRRLGGFVATVHGRRGPHLLRLPASPRGRRRAGRARRAGVGRFSKGSEDARSPANACRNCDGTGGRRRPDRIRADIVGETPNLAARLQAVAEPNSVVIAESTRKLMGNLFELDDLGAQDLKGIAGPVRAWAALRPSSAESRFEAFHATGLTELVGREEELELLLRRWSKAKTGEGQVVLLSGEAGIGKSRLTAALLERLATEPHTRLRYFCSPQHTDSAFYPIISQMERAAGVYARRRAADKARQARCNVGAEFDISPRCGTLCGDAVAAERRTLSPARSRSAATAAKDPRGAQSTDGGPVALQSGTDDRRGCPLVRPHEFGVVRSGGGPGCKPSRACCS